LHVERFRLFPVSAFPRGDIGGEIAARGAYLGVWYVILCWPHCTKLIQANVLPEGAAAQHKTGFWKYINRY
jgi:hypothetical protein